VKVGDLVKADDWVWDGRTGIIISIQKIEYGHCVGAYVLMNLGLKLIRLNNLRVIDECS